MATSGWWLEEALHGSLKDNNGFVGVQLDWDQVAQCLLDWAPTCSRHPWAGAREREKRGGSTSSGWA